MAVKLKWKVDSAPTGRYRSFEKRGFPSADYAGTDKCAVTIYCEDDYRPSDIKEGKHKELTVKIADYSAEPSFQWRTLKQRFKTLAEAKEAAIKFLSEHPVFRPDGNGK